MATALSKSDAAAVKKAAKAGGLSSSSANNVVKTANANPINANVSSNSTAVSTAPHSDGSWRDPVRASNTPDGTKYTGTADTTLPGEEAPGTPPAQPGLAGIPTQVQNNIPTPTTPGAPNSPVLSPYTAPTPPPNKFQQGLAGALGSGTTAPQNGGTGKMGVAAYTPASSPDTTAIDTYADPTIKPLMDSITQLLNPQQQTTSLLSDYNKLYKKSGLDDINQELIDADTVINGTEDDIRNEIQTAGGFGTDSQIQAMALSRNKSLLKRYNQLVQMKTDATNQLNTLSQLNVQDKQMAQTRVNSQIDAMFKLANFQQQAQNNVREAAKWGFTQDPVGFYNALAQDPQRLGNIEQILGVPVGGLQHMATTAAASTSLDTQLKKAQIANIQSEITARNTPSADMSPEDLIAYAQQYASTGQIPTGLPKGSFGAVSGYAKELPKVDGEIVDNNTNIKSSKVTPSQADGYAALKDLTNKLTEAQGLYGKLTTGLIGGTLGNLAPTQDRAAYNTLRTEIVDLLSRARSGAALSATEEERYKSLIPGTFNQTLFFGQSGESKLQGLQKSISDKLDTSLRASGVSMYGFSKVNLKGTDYHVGDVIQKNGVTGRVLPDGSIAIISQ